MNVIFTLSMSILILSVRAWSYKTASQKVKNTLTLPPLQVFQKEARRQN